LLPAIFPALTAGLPETDFTISEGQTERLLDGLASGDLDLALIATEPPHTGPRLVLSPLFADPFVLACNAAEPLDEPVHLSGIPADRILLLDEGHCFRDQAIEACMLRTRIAGHTFAATSLSTIVEFVANGQGVTLLPAISLRKETGDPRIRICELAAPAPSRTLSLVWREAVPFHALFEKAAAIIRERGASQLVEHLGALPY
jgi:LysR family hydrogen peroxide-inducible transcriptional activator